MPVLFIVVASFLKIPDTTYICALCSLAMPLGLNTIVIPSALGKDTTVAAGMAVISHLLSIITIPLIFFDYIEQNAMTKNNLSTICI